MKSHHTYQWVTLAVIAVIVISTFCLFYFVPHNNLSQDVTSTVNVTKNTTSFNVNQLSESDVLKSAPKEPEAARAEILDSLDLPFEFGLNDFYTWSESKRLDVITEMQTEYNLTQEIRGFLRILLNDKKQSETLRNNVANILLAQFDVDQTLTSDLIRMMEDKGESRQWRDYAVQHLGIAAFTSQSPDVVAMKLWEQVKTAEGGIPGTALLQLNHLNESGVIHLNDGFGKVLIALMTNTKSDLLVRMTAISLIGERKEHNALAELRHLLSDADPSIRRVTIAALGNIGNEVDIGKLDSMEDAAIDPGVVVSAVNKIRNRISDNSNNLESTSILVPVNDTKDESAF